MPSHCTCSSAKTGSNRETRRKLTHEALAAIRRAGFDYDLAQVANERDPIADKCRASSYKASHTLVCLSAASSFCAAGHTQILVAFLGPQLVTHNFSLGA